jgi:hypothetical protein
MFSCKVLVGPIATDKEYHAGDTICLELSDANTLSSLGIVEIGEEVKPKLVAQVAAIPAPAPIEVAPVVETPVVTDVAPVVETPIEIAPVSDSLPLGVIVAPEPVVEPAVVTEVTPVVETVHVDEAAVIVGEASAPADGEEVIGLEEVASSTGSKRKK